VVSTCMQSRSSVSISVNQCQSVSISGNQRTCVVAPRAIHRARQVDVVEALRWERFRVLRLTRDELVPEEGGHHRSS